MLQDLWRSLKKWRRVGVGPVAVSFRVERSAKRSRGTFDFAPALRASAALAGGGPTPHAVSHASTAFPARPTRGSAIIFGVGPGFGFALARRLCREGFGVVLISRDARRLSSLVAELRSAGGQAESLTCDVTDEAGVQRTFEKIASQFGVPALVVYSLQEAGPGAVVDVEAFAFESAWRHNCFGAFLVSRAAARAMTARGSGSIFLIGSTSSILGRRGHLNIAVGKFGQRGLAQVLARELWPLGIHVAHVLIDADIDEGQAGFDAVPQADPDDIAASIVALHDQRRSAWTSEMDLRPWNEVFWKHC